MWDLLKELLVYSALVPPALLASFSYLSDLLTGRGRVFSPDADICDLSGKIILVTGGNGGIGKETVLRLAKHDPGKVYLASRDASKARKAISDIKKFVPTAEISHLQLDLMSFDSIVEAARRIVQECSRLDIVILNAGIMATPYHTTEEGFEAQFGTNYVGHALLTKLLLPTMMETTKLPGADVRIISVSSMGHHMAPKGGIVFDPEVHKTLTPAQLYGQSKLANILHAKALATRYPDITSVAVHPGLIKTDLYGSVKRSFWLVRVVLTSVGSLVLSGVEFGALNQLWAATAPREMVFNGTYYMPVGKRMGAHKYAKDNQLANKLFDWTEAEFAKHGIEKRTNFISRG
ncbi:uncharacterized protein PV09_00470 [Verruconis gallopava]|uniref:NAD(P)-binding protein n=1 Tax=Verruconis gallopava TaxID=253628 RepID=A0A0D1Y3U7_9PEZI|nr:uncharacterized protein PV09_00470 [Verruconis gallopava]KIW09601.1 hypothetical protein PV09_00470 [Verruconis gallopava]